MALGVMGRQRKVEWNAKQRHEEQKGPVVWDAMR